MFFRKQKPSPVLREYYKATFGAWLKDVPQPDWEELAKYLEAANLNAFVLHLTPANPFLKVNKYFNAVIFIENRVLNAPIFESITCLGGYLNEDWGYDSIKVYRGAYRATVSFSEFHSHLTKDKKQHGLKNYRCRVGGVTEVCAAYEALITEISKRTEGNKLTFTILT